MSSIIRSKKSLLIAVLVVLGAGTVYAVWRHSSRQAEEPAVQQQQATAPLGAQQPTPSYDGEMNFPQGNQAVTGPANQKPAVASDASIPKATLSSLRDAFADMAQYKDRRRRKDSDRRMSKEERREISKKIRDLRRKVSPLLRGSTVAQKELMDAIRDEKDPYIKKELARLLRVTDTETQTNYYKELAADPSADTQRVAADMLSTVHTNEALGSLVGLAQNSDSDIDVRSAAVRGIGMSIPFAVDDQKYQTDARQALMGFIQPANDPQVRENAYRAIAMQTTFTPEDEKTIQAAIQKETDPQVKRMAEFVQNVIEARQRSAKR